MVIQRMAEDDRNLGASARHRRPKAAIASGT
jgi:hypothetical protein